MTRPRIRMALVAALVALLAALALPSPAAAHGALRSSEPASGALLRAAPRALRLTFNEPVELAVARLELVGPGGAAVALSPLRAGDRPSVLVADVTGALVSGAYTVRWQIAGRDGHPVRGTFAFRIASDAAGLAASADPARTAGARAPVDPARAGSAAAPPGDSSRATPTAPDAAPPMLDAASPAYALVRWGSYAATLALIGVVGFGMAVVPVARRRGATTAALDAMMRRLPGAGMVAALVLLAATALRLLAQAYAVQGGVGGTGALLGGTTWGRAWIANAAAAVAALVGASLLRRARTIGWGLLAAAVVTLAVSAALSGHAAAADARGAAIGADAVHVLAAGGWLGTLLMLAVVGLPAVRALAAAERGGAAVTLVGAFSPLALACAAVLALTGATSAWLHLGSLGALAGSPYGRTLLVKLGVVSLVAATGAYNWRRVRPTLHDDVGVRRLALSARIELAIALAVLAVTAVLVATPPPGDGA